MRTPNRVDVHVAARMRQRRLVLKLSQEKVADSLYVTFQQVQKYENGKNRMSASRLYQVAEVLECPVSYFFEGLPPTGMFAEVVADPALALTAALHGVRLAEAIVAIKNNRLRHALLLVAEAMAEETNPEFKAGRQKP